MDDITQQLKAYIETHPFDPGTNECRSILEQLYQAYAESHESDPPEISDGFKELEVFLETFPLDDNNAAFNLCCRLCIAYKRKAFLNGLQYGAHLINELFKEDKQCRKLVSRMPFMVKRRFSLFDIFLYPVTNHAAICIVLLFQCPNRNMFIQVLMDNFCFLLWCPDTFCLSLFQDYHLRIYSIIKKR